MLADVFFGSLPVPLHVEGIKRMHLNSEEMIELIQNRSDNSHLEECPVCRQQLEEWKQLLSTLSHSQLHDAPPAVLARAYGIMESPRPKFTEVLASMIFDSFTQPAFAGARGAGTARQVVLRATEFDIHVKISGSPEDLMINGQILSRGTKEFVNTATVHLVRNGARSQSVSLNGFGEFEFTNTPSGLLRLQIDLPNITVVGDLGSEELFKR